MNAADLEKIKNCPHCYCIEKALAGEQTVPHLACCRCGLSLAVCYIQGSEAYLKYKAQLPKPS